MAVHVSISVIPNLNMCDLLWSSVCKGTVTVAVHVCKGTVTVTVHVSMSVIPN